MATIPAVKVEVEQLLAEKSTPSGAADRAVHQIGAVLAKHGMLNGFAKLAATPPTAQSTGSDATSFGFPIGNDRHELTRLRLLAAKAEGNYDEVRAEAMATLTNWGGKSPRRVTAGLISQIVEGTGRPRFIAELLAASPTEQHGELLKHVAGYYSRIGLRASPKKLLAEARQAGYQI
jgi:hypothetical protein